MRLPALIVSFALGLGVAQAAESPRELLIARDGTEPWTARPTEQGVRIEQPGVAPREVPLPEGTRPTGLLALHRGWLLHGVLPTVGGSELLLIRRFGTHERAFPVPGERTGSWRLGPVPVARHGQLHSLLWLEGDRRDALAVRAARWAGSRWLPATTVSPPGNGSQLALSASLLPDGEILVVWSAFDGEDDEILWSRSHEDGWTPPARVTADNPVPDITPASVAVPGGALVAWSRFADGGYDLVTARFADGRWTVPETLVGGGALFPTFERTGSDLTLLCRRAGAPAGWEALRLDAEGRVTARAGVDDRATDRPVLLPTASGRLLFRWVDRDTEAAWATTTAR